MCVCICICMYMYIKDRFQKHGSTKVTRSKLMMDDKFQPRN